MVQAGEAMSSGKVHDPGWGSMDPKDFSPTHFHYPIDHIHSECGGMVVEPWWHLYACLLFFSCVVFSKLTLIIYMHNLF